MRKVALRPSAARDLERLVAFIAHDNLPASLRRGRQLRDAVLRLGEQPFLGVPVSRADVREIVMRILRRGDIVRYKITDDAVIIARIWRGLENRPKR